jgi:hypothetical protein
MSRLNHDGALKDGASTDWYVISLGSRPEIVQHGGLSVIMNQKRTNSAIVSVKAEAALIHEKIIFTISYLVTGADNARSAARVARHLFRHLKDYGRFNIGH